MVCTVDWECTNGARSPVRRPIYFFGVIRSQKVLMGGERAIKRTELLPVSYAESDNACATRSRSVGNTSASNHGLRLNHAMLRGDG
jgi:hypothetical protein